MSTHKYMDKLCCLALVLALVLTGIWMKAPSLGIQAASTVKGYESRLFDTSRVHTIDIVMDDWEGFLEGCTDEEYVLCDLVIDNESYQNVAIRAKGNTSLTQVASYGNDRYSFKVEFDHYDSTIPSTPGPCWPGFLPARSTPSCTTSTLRSSSPPTLTAGTLPR